MSHAGDIIGYAIARAHHSDVGGMRAGSMPSDSREIFQEGLVLPPIRLVRDGKPVEDVMKLLLANVRTPEIRRGDLRAQLAANELGARRLAELVERRGRDIMTRAFDEVIAYTERRARSRIRELPDGSYEATDVMEGDGTNEADIPIAVRVTIEREGLTIDFAGTADAVGGNINVRCL